MKVIQVVVIESRKGSGLDKNDPVRKVKSYFDLDGNLICEHDDYEARQALEPP